MGIQGGPQGGFSSSGGSLAISLNRTGVQQRSSSVNTTFVDEPFVALPSTKVLKINVDLLLVSTVAQTRPRAAPSAHVASCSDNTPVREINATCMQRTCLCCTQWRCRQRRIQAAMTVDREEKRRLLKECEDGVRRALAMDAGDARSYVILGKTLMMQKRYDEARQLYSDGCANTGG